MYEFTIYNKAINEYDFCYAYRKKDLEVKYPAIDWNAWEVVYMEFVD